MLSSMTVFIDSIHSESMSPSSTSHLWSCSSVYGPSFFDICRMMWDKMPSFHSPASVRNPYNSSDVIALGFRDSITHTGFCGTRTSGCAGGDSPASSKARRRAIAALRTAFAASVFIAVPRQFQISVLPAPGGPSTITECRTFSSSSSCPTLSMNSGSGDNCVLSQTASTESRNKLFSRSGACAEHVRAPTVGRGTA